MIADNDDAAASVVICDAVAGDSQIIFSPSSPPPLPPPPSSASPSVKQSLKNLPVSQITRLVLPEYQLLFKVIHQNHQGPMGSINLMSTEIKEDEAVIISPLTSPLVDEHQQQQQSSITNVIPETSMTKSPFEQLKESIQLLERMVDPDAINKWLADPLIIIKPILELLLLQIIPQQLVPFASTSTNSNKVKPLLPKKEFLHHSIIQTALSSLSSLLRDGFFELHTTATLEKQENQAFLMMLRTLTSIAWSRIYTGSLTDEIVLQKLSFLIVAILEHSIANPSLIDSSDVSNLLTILFTFPLIRGVSELFRRQSELQCIVASSLIAKSGFSTAVDSNAAESSSKNSNGSINNVQKQQPKQPKEDQQIEQITFPPPTIPTLHYLNKKRRNTFLSPSLHLSLLRMYVVVVQGTQGRPSERMKDLYMIMLQDWINLMPHQLPNEVEVFVVEDLSRALVQMLLHPSSFLLPKYLPSIDQAIISVNGSGANGQNNQQSNALKQTPSSTQQQQQQQQQQRPSHLVQALIACWGKWGSTILVAQTEILLQVLLSHPAKDDPKLSLQIIYHLLQDPSLVAEVFMRCDCGIVDGDPERDVALCGGGTIIEDLVNYLLILVENGFGSSGNSNNNNNNNNITSITTTTSTSSRALNLLHQLIRGQLQLQQHTGSGSSDALLLKGRERKDLYTEAANIFNTKGPKQCWQFCAQNGIFKDADDDADDDTSSTQEQASFLRRTLSLNKRCIGDLFGDPKSVPLLKAYMEDFSFDQAPIEEALRLILENFRLPPEAQQISRVMEVFAHVYYTNGKDSHVFADEDSVFILSFSIVMLNTDQHNPEVTTRMTVDDFVRNNRGINGGQDLPRDFLSKIYEVIRHREIVMPEEQIATNEGMAFRSLWMEQRRRHGSVNGSGSSGNNVSKRKHQSSASAILLTKVIGPPIIGCMCRLLGGAREDLTLQEVMNNVFITFRVAQLDPLLLGSALGSIKAVLGMQELSANGHLLRYLLRSPAYLDILKIFFYQYLTCTVDLDWSGFVDSLLLLNRCGLLWSELFFGVDDISLLKVDLSSVCNGAGGANGGELPDSPKSTTSTSTSFFSSIRKIFTNSPSLKGVVTDAKKKNNLQMQTHSTSTTITAAAAKLSEEDSKALRKIFESDIQLYILKENGFITSFVLSLLEVSSIPERPISDYLFGIELVRIMFSLQWLKDCDCDGKDSRILRAIRAVIVDVSISRNEEDRMTKSVYAFDLLLAVGCCDGGSGEFVKDFLLNCPIELFKLMEERLSTYYLPKLLLLIDDVLFGILARFKGTHVLSYYKHLLLQKRHDLDGKKIEIMFSLFEFLKVPSPPEVVVLFLDDIVDVLNIEERQTLFCGIVELCCLPVLGEETTLKFSYLSFLQRNIGSSVAGGAGADASGLDELEKSYREILNPLLKGLLGVVSEERSATTATATEDDLIVRSASLNVKVFIRELDKDPSVCSLWQKDILPTLLSCVSNGGVSSGDGIVSTSNVESSTTTTPISSSSRKESIGELIKNAIFVMEGKLGADYECLGKEDIMAVYPMMFDDSHYPSVGDLEISGDGVASEASVKDDFKNTFNDNTVIVKNPPITTENVVSNNVVDV